MLLIPPNRPILPNVLPLEDGKFMFRGAIPSISRDYGFHFSPVSAISQLGLIVFISGDSRVLAFSIMTSKFYISTDYGATFSLRTVPENYLYGLGISDDGQYTTISQYQTIQCSNDGGLTWTLKYTTPYGVIHNPDSVSVSASGQYQLVRIYGYRMARSADYGVTWAQVTGAGSRLWVHQNMSRTGQYMYAIAYYETGYGLYRSADFGVTWARVIPVNLSKIFLSGNGQYVFVSLSANNFYKSVDYGATFNLVSTPFSSSLSLSYTGRVQAYYNQYSNLMVSQDFGATFTDTNFNMTNSPLAINNLIS
jgi:photosystem II stability/assembly factor-like uncharacterized protein